MECRGPLATSGWLSLLLLLLPPPGHQGRAPRHGLSTQVQGCWDGLLSARVWLHNLRFGSAPAPLPLRPSLARPHSISFAFSFRQRVQDPPAVHLSNGSGQEPITIMTFDFTKIRKYEVDLAPNGVPNPTLPPSDLLVFLSPSLSFSLPHPTFTPRGHAPYVPSLSFQKLFLL